MPNLLWLPQVKCTESFCRLRYFCEQRKISSLCEESNSKGKQVLMRVQLFNLGFLVCPFLASSVDSFGLRLTFTRKTGFLPVSSLFRKSFKTKLFAVNFKWEDNWKERVDGISVVNQKILKETKHTNLNQKILKKTRVFVEIMQLSQRFEHISSCMTSLICQSDRFWKFLGKQLLK